MHRTHHAEPTAPAHHEEPDMHDHPTEAWPRVARLQHHPDGDPPPSVGGGGGGPGGRAAGRPDQTRVSLADLAHVADPTVVTAPAGGRQVPPQRTIPAPRVRPPGGYGMHLPRPEPRPSPDPREAVRAAAEQVAANRVRRKGLFGWKPIGGPSLVEVAAARQKIAEEEERRRFQHIRHLDALEIVRAYLGVFALILLICLVAFMAYLAFGLLVGWYAWVPTAAH